MYAYESLLNDFASDNDDEGHAEAYWNIIADLEDQKRKVCIQDFPEFDREGEGQLLIRNKWKSVHYVLRPLVLFVFGSGKRNSCALDVIPLRGAEVERHGSAQLRALGVPPLEKRSHDAEGQITFKLSTSKPNGSAGRDVFLSFKGTEYGTEWMTAVHARCTRVASTRNNEDVAPDIAILDPKDDVEI